MENLNSGKSFVESLTPETTKEEFLAGIRSVVTDEDRKVWGDNFEDQLIETVLYFVPFAPYPATFGSNAIAGVVDDVGSSDIISTLIPTLDLEHTDTIIRRTYHIIERAMELGVIEPDENGRFYIKREVQEKLEPILEKFD